MGMSSNLDTVSMTEVYIGLIDGSRRVDEGAVHVEQDSFHVNFVMVHDGYEITISWVKANP